MGNFGEQTQCSVTVQGSDSPIVILPVTCDSTLKWIQSGIEVSSNTQQMKIWPQPATIVGFLVATHHN